MGANLSAALIDQAKYPPRARKQGDESEPSKRETAAPSLHSRALLGVMLLQEMAAKQLFSYFSVAECDPKTLQSLHCLHVVIFGYEVIQFEASGMFHVVHAVAHSFNCIKNI